MGFCSLECGDGRSYLYMYARFPQVETELFTGGVYIRSTQAKNIGTIGWRIKKKSEIWARGAGGGTSVLG